MIDELAVQHVLSHYVRAHDRRDGTAMAALFTPGGHVVIDYNKEGNTEPMGELVGREAIAGAVAHMMKPHPALGWSHNATDGLIVTVAGDKATLDAQFMVFNIVGTEKPVGGWPTGAAGAQGSIEPIESGYYSMALVRVADFWLIEQLRVTHNLPFAF